MKGTVAVRFTAAIEPSFDAAFDVWERMAEEGDALPFQRRPWLAAWASTIGRGPELDLLPVTVRDGAGAPIAGIPLVRERRGLRRIGFADGGLVDYNAPILGRNVPQDRDGAARLWAALRHVLPPADTIRLERMPRRVGARANPLALLPDALPSRSLGLALTLEHGYEGWVAARPRRYRMELGRCARLFDALPGARFERVAARDASGVLCALETLQRSRVAALERPYALDDPRVHAFHHALAADGDAGTLFALRVGEEIVAALFGIRVGAGFIMLRVAADPEHARCSPARLVITRAMERLAAEGVRTIDFGLGDYDYKRRLGGEAVDLVDLVAARSWRGLGEFVGHRGRAALRANPRAQAAARHLRDALRAPRFRPTRSS